MSNLTRHGKRQALARVGITAGNIQRQADRIFDCGIRHNETTGELRQYLNGIYLAKHNANNLRVYGKHVYLFAGPTLITVFHLPESIAQNMPANLTESGLARYEKIKSEKGKYKKKQAEEEERRILDAVNNLAKYEEGNFRAVKVERQMEGRYTIYYTSDRAYNDWRNYMDLLFRAKEELGFSIEIRHQKVGKRFLTN